MAITLAITRDCTDMNELIRDGDDTGDCATLTVTRPDPSGLNYGHSTPRSGTFAA